MATINHLSPPPSLRLFSPQSSQNTPTLSFYSHSKPSLTCPSLSLTKPFIAPKPRASVIASAFKSLSETELVTVPEAPDQFAGKLPLDSGVYAVFDSSGDLQFIGLSRNIAASILAHRKSLPELCYSVKVLNVFRFSESHFA